MEQKALEKMDFQFEDSLDSVISSSSHRIPKQGYTIEDIPEDCLRVIAGFLHLSDIANLSCTSKYIHGLQASMGKSKKIETQISYSEHDSLYGTRVVPEHVDLDMDPMWGGRSFVLRTESQSVVCQFLPHISNQEFQELSKISHILRGDSDLGVTYQLGDCKTIAPPMRLGFYLNKMNAEDTLVVSIMTNYGALLDLCSIRRPEDKPIKKLFVPACWIHCAAVLHRCTNLLVFYEDGTNSLTDAFEYCKKYRNVCLVSDITLLWMLDDIVCYMDIGIVYGKKEGCKYSWHEITARLDKQPVSLKNHVSRKCYRSIW